MAEYTGKGMALSVAGGVALEGLTKVGIKDDGPGSPTALDTTAATDATYTSCPADGSGTPAWLLSADKVSIDVATNTEALGQVLYTRYVYYFQAAGLVLLCNLLRIGLSIVVGIESNSHGLVVFHDWVGTAFGLLYVLGGFTAFLFLLLPSNARLLAEATGAR